MTSSFKWKNRLSKVVRWGVPALCTTVAVLITVTIGWRPVFGAKSRPLNHRQFERTPERLARGKYLVEGVLGCFDCHSQVATEQVAPGAVPPFTQFGSGRVVIDAGDLRVAAPNITPDLETGAGTWTDDQFARAIREGIGHDGRTLFPMMPYQDFRELSDEDLAAAIVFIRSLPPVRHELPPNRIPFPLSRLINSAPQPLHGPVAANVSDPVSRGRYLSQSADATIATLQKTIWAVHCLVWTWLAGPCSKSSETSRPPISLPIRAAFRITTKPCS